MFPMKIALHNRRIAISAALILALFVAQFPNTSVNAATVCIGPAAYPPDLPDCLDPVVLAKQEADRKAAEQAAAGELDHRDAGAGGEDRTEQEPRQRQHNVCERFPGRDDAAHRK